MIKREKHAVTIYTRYERFWHWSQAVLIFMLAFTGFGLHGTHDLLPFQQAVMLHTFSAIALILLWIFTTFWNFTTGNWRQFLPNTKG
ncbi:MAG: cytochrome b/b6 domain-containing protein, partial [Sedimenticola sp.]|nr:cytochrome b/b6 domain-containing protein [Sedimenticola sp.]MCW8882835.1 cytochrome b/b6 domain-containing protein [Sedimenticola sp.]